MILPDQSVRSHEYGVHTSGFGTREYGVYGLLIRLKGKTHLQHFLQHFQPDFDKRAQRPKQ